MKKPREGVAFFVSNVSRWIVTLSDARRILAPISGHQIFRKSTKGVTLDLRRFVRKRHIYGREAYDRAAATSAWVNQGRRLRQFSHIVRLPSPPRKFRIGRGSGTQMVP
jgi:hypothetical protein